MGALNKLSALQVQRLSKRGRYGDGGGLYLQVSPSGSKSWIFRYQLKQKAHEIGLGSLNAISLAEAREKAYGMRNKLANGIDPLTDRIEAERKAALESARSITFKACAEAFIQSMGTKWKNGKHRAQWSSTLEAYVFPVIGNLAVADIETALVVKILTPIWHEKTETASRVRGRIESILGYAAANRWRAKENPAQWKGHLDKILPAPSEIAKVEHHRALAINDVGNFCAELRSKSSLTARALELLILTALRPGELVGARWEEIDLAAEAWTVPAERMKKKEEHRIPLSKRAIELFTALRSQSDDERVFPGMGAAPFMSTNSLLKLVKEMRPGLELTSHGFRSTFKDWSVEHTNFPNEVSEMALAHKVKSKVEAAYRRGDLFLKRRGLMEEWAKFCASPSSNSATVVKLSSKPA